MPSIISTSTISDKQREEPKLAKAFTTEAWRLKDGFSMVGLSSELAGFAGRGRRSRYTANCSIRVLTKLQFSIMVSCSARSSTSTKVVYNRADVPPKVMAVTRKDSCPVDLFL